VNQTAHQRGYADPIAIGVLLGLLLFAVILMTGRGLGASGGFAAGAAATVDAVASATAAGNPYIAERVPDRSGGLLGDWLVLELIGVAGGAWWSSRRAGRARLAIDRVSGEASRNRVLRAALGGVLMGGGARLAHGCTSGLGLTGGAMLNTGAWLFIPVAFGTAFLVAWLLGNRTAAVAP
jgi:uncharacterized membrane protein YedE/YeeE